MSVVMLSAIYAKCRNKVHYDECHYVKYHYADCHGDLKSDQPYNRSEELAWREWSYQHSA